MMQINEGLLHQVLRELICFSSFVVVVAVVAVSAICSLIRTYVWISLW